MNEFDREFFTNIIERVINAYQCGVSHLPDKRCKNCPYDYGYLDDWGIIHFGGVIMTDLKKMQLNYCIS